MQVFEKIDKNAIQSVFSEIYDLTASTENHLLFKLDGMAGLWYAEFYDIDNKTVVRIKNQSAAKAMGLAIRKVKNILRGAKKV